MDEARPHPGLLRLTWRRLLDGDRPWGSIDIRPDRFGVTRYRLVVYPPGISRAERRWVRVARGWPLWGVLVWIGAELWLTHVTGRWTALAISTAAVIGSGLTAVGMAGEPRTRVRTMAAMVMVGQRDPVAVAARDRIEKLAAMLIEADERVAHRRISASDHELTWWRVYNEMAPKAATAA